MNIPICACVLAKVQPGQALSVVPRIQAIPEVGLVAAVTGGDDLLVIVRANDPVELGQIIINKLQQLPVIETRTMVVVGDLVPVNWLTSAE